MLKISTSHLLSEENMITVQKQVIVFSVLIFDKHVPG